MDKMQKKNIEKEVWSEDKTEERAVTWNNKAVSKFFGLMLRLWNTTVEWRQQNSENTALRKTANNTSKCGTTSTNNPSTLMCVTRTGYKKQ